MNQNELSVREVLSPDHQARWAVYQYQIGTASALGLDWADSGGRSVRVSEMFRTREEAEAELRRIDALINESWTKFVRRLWLGIVCAALVGVALLIRSCG